MVFKAENLHEAYNEGWSENDFRDYFNDNKPENWTENDFNDVDWKTAFDKYKEARENEKFEDGDKKNQFNEIMNDMVNKKKYLFDKTYKENQNFRLDMYADIMSDYIGDQLISSDNLKEIKESVLTEMQDYLNKGMSEALDKRLNEKGYPTQAELKEAQAALEEAKKKKSKNGWYIGVGLGIAALIGWEIAKNVMLNNAMEKCNETKNDCENDTSGNNIDCEKNYEECVQQAKEDNKGPFERVFDGINDALSGLLDGAANLLKGLAKAASGLFMKFILPILIGIIGIAVLYWIFKKGFSSAWSMSKNNNNNNTNSGGGGGGSGSSSAPTTQTSTK